MSKQELDMQTGELRPEIGGWRPETGDHPMPKTSGSLYDARFEHDACGIGFVAQKSGAASHHVLELAIMPIAAQLRPMARAATAPVS